MCKNLKTCFCTLGGSIGCLNCEVYEQHLKSRGLEKPSVEEMQKNIEEKHKTYIGYSHETKLGIK